MRILPALWAFIFGVSPLLALGQNTPAPQTQTETQTQSQPQTAGIIGTVTDPNNGVVPGATVVLTGPTPADRSTTTANDNGFFTLKDLRPAVTYHLTVSAKDFSDWTSPPIILTPGQQLDLADIKLKISLLETNVSAVSDEKIATEEVKVAEKQRVLGLFPNFYVVYKAHPVPLPTKLKFKLALRASYDPMNFVGIAFVAGLGQAGDSPNYQQGWDGYAQRYGAAYTDGFTDIMIGGAILPSLLHQDPRYFYKGTGTKRSRLLHALSSPFVCPGDNGRLQFNYSSIGGDLASGALSNLYYPQSNRGPGLVFTGALITTGGRMVNAILQEFFLRRFTPSAKKQN